MVAPVVEVAGDQQRRVLAGERLHASGEGVHLPASAAGHQAQMHADAVDGGQVGAGRDFAVEQAATLEAVVRHVLVVRAQNREAAENRIAMVAVVIDGVAAVSAGRPDVAGEEFVLRLDRPVRVARGVAKVQALHLLQEDDIHFQLAQPVAQLVNHHAAIELRETLVDVVGTNAQAHGRRRLPAKDGIIRGAVGACTDRKPRMKRYTRLR